MVNLHLHIQMMGKDLKSRKKAQPKLDNLDMADMELEKGVEYSRKLYPSIELVHDPQGLVEDVFQWIKSEWSNSYRIKMKLLVINFIPCLVGSYGMTITGCSGSNRVKQERDNSSCHVRVKNSAQHLNV